MIIKQKAIKKTRKIIAIVVWSLVFFLLVFLFKVMSGNNTYEIDKNGEEILEPCRCLYYKTGSWMDKDSEKVGLMSPEGKPLTKPLYDNITGIGFDLYKAENAGNYIVINGKGQTVN